MGSKRRDDMQFFLINDTRYDNHHGCETVVSNLISGMAVRGWHCAGSLAVGKGRDELERCQHLLDNVDLVVVNGEGSLHHDQLSVEKIMSVVELCLQRSLRVVILNALWQHNSIGRYRQLLEQVEPVYVRDTYSERELSSLGVACRYVPDLTFMSEYSPVREPATIEIGFTDSVKNSTATWLYRLAQDAESSLFLPALFRDPIHHNYSSLRLVKRWLYPRLYRALGIRVRQNYINMAYGINDTNLYIEQLRRCGVVVAGRYHVLCFCLQNGIPFITLESNSHKVPALLEEIGLDYSEFVIEEGASLERVRKQCERVRAHYDQVRRQIEDFNQMARSATNAMLDDITEGK